MARKFIIVALLFILGASLSSCVTNSYYSPDRSAGTQDVKQNNSIYEDLAKQGRMTTGEITTVYGVPCIEVMLNDGESMRTLVYSIPALKKNPIPAQDRISLINGTHYLLVVNGPGNISTEKNKIFVPLDFSIEPQILPEFLSEAAKHAKYILINRRQQYLGLYENGHLKYCFPISSGTRNSTPLKKFVVNYLDEVHYSSKYEQAPMDHALNIGGDYFIHEGIVPGYPASHGCIRIFPLHARFLFYQWAKPGIPGKIIG